MSFPSKRTNAQSTLTVQLHPFKCPRVSFYREKSKLCKFTTRSFRTSHTLYSFRTRLPTDDVRQLFRLERVTKHVGAQNETTSRVCIRFPFHRANGYAIVKQTNHTYANTSPDGYDKKRTSTVSSTDDCDAYDRKTAEIKSILHDDVLERHKRGVRRDCY